MAALDYLGNHLNTVTRSQFPCPNCGRREQMQVCEKGVLWRCGAVTELPPMPVRSRGRFSKGMRRP